MKEWIIKFIEPFNPAGCYFSDIFKHYCSFCDENNFIPLNKIEF